MRGAAADAGGIIRAALPGGVWCDKSEPIRHVRLRAVAGDDEVFLLDVEGTFPAGRATALLERCVVDADATVESLTVGDREALLLQLRRLTLGDDLHCVLRCPQASCGEQLELSFAVGDVLLPPYDDVRREYTTAFMIDGREHRIRFRLPRADDLNIAAGAADSQGGAARLLRACVIQATVDHHAVTADELDARAGARIAEEMVARDPQAEIELDAHCPACGHHFDVPFDAGTFLLQELEARARRLLADVHLLALHYHWSERDILAMSPARRDRYLDLLAAGMAQDTTLGSST